VLGTLKTKSIRNIALVGVGNVFNAFLAFAYLTTVARALPLEDFGKYSLMVSILLFAGKGTDFGTNNIYVTRALTEEKATIKKTFLSTKMLLIGLIALFSPWVLVVFDIKDPLLLLIFLFGLFVYSFNFILQAIFQKEQRFGMYLATNSIPAFIKGGFAAAIFFNMWTPNLTLAFLVFCLSTAPALLLSLQADLGRFIHSRTTEIKNFLAQSFPAGISQVIAESWPAINNGLIKIMSGFTGVGLFSLAEKMASIFKIVSHSIFTVLLPKNALLKKRHAAYDYLELGIISVGIMLAAVVANALAGFFVRQFFGTKFESSISVLHILLYSAAITAIHTFLESFFYAENKVELLAKINIARLAGFIFLAGTLAYRWGLVGLALANLSISICTLVAVATIVFRLRRVELK
jgi:O-antigen/teichoic acid export membrane protein